MVISTSMATVRRPRGFTLIEVTIVVVVVGVLALLAVEGYRRWIQTSYIAEAQDMVANIRTAEESFRSENGVYLDVSGTLGPGYEYPAATPGPFKTQWATGSRWDALTVRPAGPVYFGYSVIANNGGGSPSVPTPGFGIDFSGLTGPWYVIRADGDLDRDSDANFTEVFGCSGTNQIWVVNEGK
jgi:type IV pilus assembly protein PilA